ncbi:endonuclease/exonuclease/phosphatase family protein [Vibrio clamense]|uniref:endonuclease/exonuclease/phosphatase family protein n=1 Tax=Vibrio clamense TaxID=2910254 RepID=UPI003D1ED40E
MNKTRVINYEKVVEALKADVVALQEVRDRFAVERFFSPDKWDVIIDDDSTDDMNLAYAIRKEVQYRLTSRNRINADEVKDFAIDKNNQNFVDQRRVLKLYVTYKGHEVLLLNHHAKSRYNGRAITDEQRTLSALALISVISNSSTPYVALLGDFNDTPDDASLNTLENGQLTGAEAENRVGDFLVNMTEPLLKGATCFLWPKKHRYGSNDNKNGGYIRRELQTNQSRQLYVRYASV